jgi:hypothetical protein
MSKILAPGALYRAAAVQSFGEKRSIREPNLLRSLGEVQRSSPKQHARLDIYWACGALENTDLLGVGGGKGIRNLGTIIEWRAYSRRMRSLAIIV